MASPFVAEFSSPMGLRATLLLKENIDSLLRRRGYHRKDLAKWCYRTEGWLSKIYRNPKREIPMEYYDRIADFFGLTVYQLFQPGIASSSERRKHTQRRQGLERRMARRTDAMDQQTSQTRAQPTVGVEIEAVSIKLVDEIAVVAAKLTELSLLLAQLKAQQPREIKPKSQRNRA